MKKYLFVFLIFCAFNSSAQTSATIPALDDKAVVKDASGNIMPTILWRAYHKTGDYSFRYIKEDNSFLIFQMTPAQKAVADERKEAMLASSAQPRLS